LSFTEDFVVIPTIDLEIQLFVGKVMALYESRWKTQHNALLKLNASLPKDRSAGRVVEWKLVLQRICRNSEDLYIEIKYLWDW
ncbi:hypothetical protein, partial [Leptospira interrogans]